MRRIAVALFVVLAVAAALIASGAGGGGGPSERGYRVDAIFDNADFLVTGQDVKIAGAVVGEVTGVHLTRDRRARVEMRIENGFAPFRSDATCTIRPQSLIGEKFVDCEPGSPRGRALGGEVPTVPLARNHSPVDLDLVFAALRLPYRQRLAILVNELGSGLAGRPEDLNEAIRRANPALQRANRVLAIVDSDRHTLGRLIEESDRVVARLAAHRGEVTSFIGRADAVARSVASRRGDLGLAIDRLPPLLREAQPAAEELASFADEARPVARDLRGAAEPVRLLLADLDPLTRAADPTLRSLSELSHTGRRAVRHALPVADALLPVAKRVPRIGRLARTLLVSLKDSGGIEGLLRYMWLGAVVQARFDTTSHIIPSYQISGSCQQYATAPADGCSAHFADGPQGKAKAKATADPALDYLLGK